MNTDEVKKHIYDKSAKLSQQFIDFIKHEGVPDYLLPLFDNNSGYRCDWNIIGGEEAKEGCLHADYTRRSKRIF